MSLKKDSPKWKAILLGIDIALLVLALCIGGYCVHLAVSISSLPDAAMLTENIRAQQEQADGLEAQIREQTQALAQAEEAGQATLTAAADALAAVQAEYDAVSAEHAGLNSQVEEFENSLAKQEQLKLDIAAIRTQYGQTIRKLEDMVLAGESDYKICYLTFDDGPSYLTSQFLDKIDALDIYVTFFTIGVQMGESGYGLRDELLRREALSGHAIANHTYTHGIYDNLYRSLDDFIDAVERQDQLVYEVTGMHTDVVRFPAGSYYCPFRDAAIAELEEKGFGWIDWIGNAYDSGNHTLPSSSVSYNVIWQVRQDLVTVVLMHDWRAETLGALEDIVTTLKAENYLFLPLFKESSTVGTARPRWDG